jgi:hypothetical protein
VARKPPGLTAAVEGFLAAKRFDDREQVTAALLLELARSLEESPPYARGRLGAEIRACLEELRFALQRDEEKQARVRQRSWIQAAAAEQDGDG